MDIVPEGRGCHIGREGSSIPHDSLMYLLDIIMYNTVTIIVTDVQKLQNQNTFVFGSLKFQSLF